MVFNAVFCARFPDFMLDVDITLPTEGVTAIFGPSGAGKTSLLRCIAGLHKASKGHLTFQGTCWQSEKIFLPTHQRPIGYVFQESSLFDHMTVQQNLDYGRQRCTTPMNQGEFDHIIDLLDLSHLLSRHSSHLSGGERQRVAIARALVIKPELLLMDEPMASLDMARKREILNYLERLKSELQIPLLYISHNVDEVTRLADYLVILDQGRVQVQGTVEQILSNHKILNSLCDEPFTLLFGQVQTPNNGHQLTLVDLGNAVIAMPVQNVIAGQRIRLHLYAKDVSLTLSPARDTSILNILECRLETIEPVTSDGQCLIHLSLGTTLIQARVSAFSCEELKLRPAMKIFAQIKAVSVMQ